MKLSERIQKHFSDYLDLYTDVDLAPDGDNEDGLISSVLKLESDSQMLDDLFEMLKTSNCYRIVRSSDTTWCMDKVEPCGPHTTCTVFPFGDSPREAIAAAIKEWKKSK